MLTECFNNFSYYETEYQNWGCVKQQLHKALVQKSGNVYQIN